MLTFSDLANEHPYSKPVTLRRDGRGDDLVATAIVRLGAETEVDGSGLSNSVYQARFELGTDVKQNDNVTIGADAYRVVAPPLERPDENSVVAELEIASAR